MALRGLRKSEFLGLRWRDVDFKAGILTVPRSKNGEARHVPMKRNRPRDPHPAPSAVESDGTSVSQRRG
ncbi:MAG: hypothetical protein DMD96_00965 [Candidatus Rokuibacteriota bacterium]|nr:MAG: hypothetical protein DMD96_00965 [Candidatus Rokubacteria bacterium]